MHFVPDVLRQGLRKFRARIRHHEISRQIF